jgi:hypothetical protein
MKFSNLFNIIIVGLLLALSLNACKKDEDTLTKSSQFGDLTVSFQNYVGDSILRTSTKYINSSNDTFTVSVFNYYISNVKITAIDGSSTFAEVDSAHLLTISTNSFDLKHIPIGHYKSITFTIGVDSARNVSGKVLDSTMYFGNGNGYIMAKLEGHSPQVKMDTTHTFRYDIGGYSGIYNVLKTKTITFGSVDVSNLRKGKIIIKADAKLWFDGMNKVSVKTLKSILMPGADAKMMSDNYANSFTALGVE